MILNCKIIHCDSRKPIIKIKQHTRTALNENEHGTPISSHNTIAARLTSPSLIRVYTRQLTVNALSRRISSTLNFHESIGTDWIQTCDLLYHI